MQNIFTTEILEALAANGRATREAQDRHEREPDHKPVIKVFNPYGRAAWLLTESNPDNPDRLFGLCDLGIGSPEIGYVLRRSASRLAATACRSKHWGNMRTTQTRLEGSWPPPSRTVNITASCGRTC